MNLPAFAAVPLSLYIHIPWCVRKCPYCDFNSHTLREDLPEHAYVQAVLADLEADLPEVWGRRINSIFIGGGTPSLFSPESLHELLAGVRARLPLRPTAEITLEANPGTVDSGRFAAFRQAGINRLSIGIQSLDDAALQALERIHDRQQAIRAVEAAQKAGFDNFNVDLMFGLPQQNQAAALRDLQLAMDLQPPHLSWYQLTLEHNTKFYRQPPVGMPDDDLLWDMQQAGQDLLARRGYAQYEVSAYAQAGRRCQHNLNYWQFGDYLGLGAGAHGKLSNAQQGAVRRYSKIRHPRAYLQATTGFIQEQQCLDEAALRLEFMLNALRLVEGFETHWFVERTGLSLNSLHNALQTAVQNGWLIIKAEHIQPSAEGMRFLDELLLLF